MTHVVNSVFCYQVQFEGEGMKLADGRIYVPLPFIHKNFPNESEWPVQLPADIFVNEDCIKEAYPVSVCPQYCIM
jgi:hypothetical protein